MNNFVATTGVATESECGPNFWTIGKSFFTHSTRLFTQPGAVLGRIIVYKLKSPSPLTETKLRKQDSKMPSCDSRPASLP